MFVNKVYFDFDFHIFDSLTNINLKSDLMTAMSSTINSRRKVCRVTI